MGKKQLIHLSKATKRLAVFSLFGLLALGSASSTLLFMGKNTPSTELGNGETNENNQTVDEVKNKLFENLTAANLNINDLKIHVGGLLGKNTSLDVSFTGGANYMSFIANETGNTSALTPEEIKGDITAKFGGKINIDLKDGNKNMLNEVVNVYTPGAGTIYLGWNATGYSVSGKFINSALQAITIFLTPAQNQSLNAILEKIQSIDILTLLPMVGTLGGSLASDRTVLENGDFRYQIIVPGNLVDPNFNQDITINLDSTKTGELVDLSLNPLTFNVGGKDLTISLGTKNRGITMVGINSTNRPQLDGYIQHGNLAGNNPLEDYYNNNLDSTPNLIYTVGKMMKAKQFKFNYSLNFDEYIYDEKIEAYKNPLNEKLAGASHEFVGSLSGDFSQGFNNGIYAFSLDKNQAFGNQVNVQFQGNNLENAAKGLFVSFNNINGYMSDASINDLMKPVDNVAQSQTVSQSFDTANSILNNSVIGDIISGNWNAYKNILKEITIKNDTTDPESVNLKIKVLLGGLNLNIPFAFESTPVEIIINYKNTANMEKNLIQYLEIKNIPLRKVSRVENGVTKTYLDATTLRLNLDGASFDSYPIKKITTTEADTYVDFKATIPLFKSISDIANKKQFKTDYTLTYNSKKFDPLTFNGYMAGDLTSINFNSTAALTDKNFGTYRLTAHTRINDINHNIFLDYAKNPTHPANAQDQSLFFDYYSLNQDYRTRLSLDTQTMTSMFDSISKLIAKQNGQNNQQGIDQTNKDVFGNITSTLNSMTDFLNGSIWNVLSAQLPTDKVTIENDPLDKETLIVKMPLSLFASNLTSGQVDLTLSKTNRNKAAIKINFALPNSTDTVDFTLAFTDFEANSVGITLEQAKMYKKSDSSVNAVMDLLTGNYLDAFKIGGFVSTKRQLPRI